MKLYEIDGIKKSLSEWCKEYGISYDLVYKRVNRNGWDIKRALETGGKNPYKKKVMVINDVHVPYQHEGLIEEIKKHKDIDYLVIGGDLIDCESCSSFPMLDRPTLEEELIEAHKFIKEIYDITDADIICIKGNHSERLEKEIMKMHEKNLQKFLNPRLLDMLSEGFSFYQKGVKVEYEPLKNFQYIDKWYAKLFDNMVICHPKNFSNIPARVAEQCAEYFLNKGVINSEDIVILGHTHKYSSIVASRRQNVFVIENGCCCKEMDYADCGRLGYSDQTNCYTIIEFEEGKKIDKNNIKTFFFS